MKIETTISWFSSKPTWSEIKSEIDKEINQPESTLKNFKEIQIEGETVYGPHTTIKFKADNFQSAYYMSCSLSHFLYSKYPDVGKGTGGVVIRFNDKTVYEMMNFVDQLVEILKQPVIIFPKKKIHKLGIK